MFLYISQMNLFEVIILTDLKINSTLSLSEIKLQLNALCLSE